MDPKIIQSIKEAAIEKKETLIQCENKIRIVSDSLRKLQQDQQGLRETLYAHANFLNQYAKDEIPRMKGLGVARNWEAHLGLCTKRDPIE